LVQPVEGEKWHTPDLLNESISKQTMVAKTFILHILPRINTFVTNCMSRKVAYSLMLE